MAARRARRVLYLVTLLPLLMAACSDLRESSYSSMAEARRVGALDRGWLPDILPDAATNLREIHNIDTNQTWCAFELAPSETARLRGSMVPVKVSDLPEKTLRTPGVRWWPSVLQGTLDQAAIDRAGLKLYVAGPLLFAFESNDTRGFMHRRRAP